MVAVTAPRRGLSGYTSFPRTGPPRSHSHESTHSSPPSSPWFACNAKTNVTPDETSNVAHHHLHPYHPHQPPPSTRMIAVHHKTRQQESSRQQQQRQSPRYSNQQQQRQPNYPATIEFTPSQDYPGHHINHFDETNFNMSLNELSLEDTFGFAANSNNDDLFERLYTGNDDEDNTYQSSIDLNPYTAKDFGAKLNPTTKQMKQNNEKLPQNDTMNITNRNTQPQAASKPIQRERDSIFRTPNHEPHQISPPPNTSSYEKKINENMQMISPTVAMDRRRKKAQDQAQPNIMSPNSSFFTSASPAVPGPVKSVQSGPLQCGTVQCGAPGIQRANTATSILRNHTATPSSSILRRNNTGTTASSSRSSRNRNRSTSRNHRSRSRGTSISRSGGGGDGRRRSRSRSICIAAHPKKEDDYHQNLFRGAKMIREQLLRSMASADQAMDEAEREFMEEMIERGGKTGGGDGRQRKKVEKDDSFDNGDIDFDYSFDHGKAGDVKTGVVPSPPRGNCIKPSVSQDSSALETESRRLDNLMSIFVANSCTSSSNVGLDTNRSPSDKENGLQARTTFGEVNAPTIISPSSTLGMGSPMSQLMSPTQQAKAYNEYASQYFQEDAPKPSPASRYFQEDVPKPIATSPSVDSARTSAKNSNSIARSDHAYKQHAHPKYQTHKESPRKYQEEEVDEAMAHAQRAGPLWRSLVGNHVRFPSRWDSLLPSTLPPIHSLNQKWSKWYYVARHRVKGDKRLNSREFGVRSRRTGGRILMKLVVRGMHSQQVCREIAIGCFHPNSKGVRKGDPLPDAEDVREVWMAARWLMDVEDLEPSLDLRIEGNNYEGVVDNFLMQKKRTLDYGSMGSALGHRKAVNNENVRAIFGDQPPMTTVDLHEDEVAEILKANGRKKLAVLPALMLLKLFLFSK